MHLSTRTYLLNVLRQRCDRVDADLPVSLLSCTYRSARFELLLIHEIGKVPDLTLWWRECVNTLGRLSVPHLRQRCQYVQKIFQEFNNRTFTVPSDAALTIC